MMPKCSTLTHIVHELAGFYNTDCAALGKLWYTVDSSGSHDHRLCGASSPQEAKEDLL